MGYRAISWIENIYACADVAVCKNLHTDTHRYTIGGGITTKENDTWGQTTDKKVTYFKVVWIKASKLQSNSLVRTSSTVH